MLKEVIRLSILPALLLESGAGHVGNEDAQPWIEKVEKTFLPHLRHIFSDTPPLRLSAELSEEAMARLLHPMRLSRSWHHPGITIPAELRPLRINRTWRAILPQPWHDPGTGLSVVCLSDSDSLTQESEMLYHCVGYGGYDERCCLPEETRSHIFSIRDAEGHALSTVETTYKDGQFIVKQHAGKDNATPPPQARQAWDSFTQALETQPNLLTKEPLGEVRQDQLETVPRIWRSIGFKPSWENIDRIFDEYRMPYRRASIPTKGRRMVYDDLVTPDGYKLPHHFISGYALADDRNVPIPGSFRQQRNDFPPREAGQHIVDLRDLDAQSWLRATGLMEEIHKFIKENAMPLASPMRESQSEQPLHFRPIPTPQYKVREATEHNLGNPSKAMPSEGFVRHSAADSSPHGISP